MSEYHVRSGDGATGPWCFTVGTGRHVGYTWTLSDTSAATATYDYAVYGPNGYYRRFAGSVASGAANLGIVATDLTATGGISLDITNHGGSEVEVQVTNLYDNRIVASTLSPGKSFSHSWDLGATHNWYDLVATVSSDPAFQQHIAGHVETGRDSYTDPGMAGSV